MPSQTCQLVCNYTPHRGSEGGRERERKREGEEESAAITWHRLIRLPRHVLNREIASRQYFDSMRSLHNCRQTHSGTYSFAFIFFINYLLPALNMDHLAIVNGLSSLYTKPIRDSRTNKNDREWTAQLSTLNSFLDPQTLWRCSQTSNLPIQKKCNLFRDGRL